LTATPLEIGGNKLMNTENKHFSMSILKEFVAQFTVQSGAHNQVSIIRTVAAGMR